jgi:hypothetical protein
MISFDFLFYFLFLLFSLDIVVYFFMSVSKVATYGRQSDLEGQVAIGIPT